jgi:TIR domain/Phage integrase, N-terminal SAM-like domain
MKKKPVKLLEGIRQKLSENNYSSSTSKLYVNWIKRYIIFHGKRHPRDLSQKHIGEFLNHLAIDKNLSHTTQIQALSAIKFLYRQVLDNGWLMLDNFIWVNKSQKRKVKVKIEPKNNRAKLNVFLCHAKEDKSKVRKLYSQLKRDGTKPWFDEEDLIGGQDWEFEIEKAVGESDIVIVCLSKESITKAGYVQKEIKFALDIADKQPEASIFIIPIRLENCELPKRLSKWQSIEAYETDGYLKILKSLNRRAQSL